jgi:DNA-binding response OmpR family regulator
MEATAPLLLYVEDEALIAMVIIMALEEAGFGVHHILDGRSAMAKLEQDVGTYRALVTDVRLPQVDGWAIAQRARELNPALPVIYVSGDSASDWGAKGVPNSIMVQKPFANAQLVAAVTTLLNQAGAAPASN